jgi:hypothetical protein
MSSSVGGRQYNDDDSGTGVSAGCSGNANENTNNAKNNSYSKTYYDDDYYKYSKNNKISSDSLMSCGNQASSCDQWWGGMQVMMNTSYSSL